MRMKKMIAIALLGILLLTNATPISAFTEQIGHRENENIPLGGIPALRVLKQTQEQ